MQIPAGNQSIAGNLTPQQVQKLEKDIEAIAERLIKQKMGEILEEVIKATPPYAKRKDRTSGGLAAGEKVGQANIKRDVSKIFNTVRSVPFRQLVANRDWEAMAAYNITFKNPEYIVALANKDYDSLYNAFTYRFPASANIDLFLRNHQEMQRIHQQVRRGGVIKMPPSQKFLVKDKKAISDYTSIVAQSIGKMISGWYDAARQLSMSSLKSPFKKTGTSQVKWEKGGEIGLTVGNPLGDYDKILSNNFDCQKIVDDAAKHVEQMLEQEINALVMQLLNGQPGAAKAPPGVPKPSPAAPKPAPKSGGKNP